MSEEKLTQDIVEGMVTKMARELPYEKQKIFFLLLAERTFRCYKKHSEGKRWDCVEHLNQIIEDCWDYMINGTEYDYMIATRELYNDDDITEEWESEMYGNSPEYVFDTNDHSMFEYAPGNVTVLSEIVKNIYVTFAFLTREGPHQRFGSGDYTINFTVIEEYVAEYYLDTNDEEYQKLLYEHPVTALEFEREKRDIEYLKQEDDLKKIYQKYRFEMNESLLEDYWFEEEYL